LVALSKSKAKNIFAFLEEDEKALASGLRNIDISGSDSDTDAFLPSFRRRRRLKETLSLSESAL
jgi:hypothetical protein